MSQNIRQQLANHSASTGTWIYSHCSTNCSHQKYNWKDTTNSLLSALNTPAFTANFLELTSSSSRVKFIWDQAIVRQRINAFINHFATLGTVCDWHRKCGPFSETIRNTLGNGYYTARKFKEAYHYYSLALAFAPVGSKEAALAYGNRSAVLYEQKYYEAAIGDVNRAVAAGYASYNKLSKILKRKVISLAHLGRFAEAKAVLANDLPLSEGKIRLELLGELLKLNQAAETTVTPIDAELFDELVDELRTTRSDRFPTMSRGGVLSDKLELRMHPVLGVQAVAKEDIRFGELLAINIPLAMMQPAEFDYQKCHHCLADMTLDRGGSGAGSRDQRLGRFPSFVSVPTPCPHCPRVLYCSQRCQDQAWITYHRYECIHNGLLNTFPNNNDRLALRFLYTAGLDAVAEVLQQSDDDINILKQSEYHLLTKLKPDYTKREVTDEQKIRFTITACLLVQLTYQNGFISADDRTRFPEHHLGGLLYEHLLQIETHCEVHGKASMGVGPGLSMLTVEIRMPSLVNLLFPHSCLPNLGALYFEKGKLQHMVKWCIDRNKGDSLLKATRPVRAGEVLTVAKDIPPKNCTCIYCSALKRDNPFSNGEQGLQTACLNCGQLVDRSSGTFRCTNSACAILVGIEEMKRRHKILERYIGEMQKRKRILHFEKNRQVRQNAAEELEALLAGNFTFLSADSLLRDPNRPPNRLVAGQTMHYIGDANSTLFHYYGTRLKRYEKALPIAYTSLQHLEQCYGRQSLEMLDVVQGLAKYWKEAPEEWHSRPEVIDITQRAEELGQMFDGGV